MIETASLSTVRGMAWNWRVAVLVGLSLPVFVWLAAQPPIPQPVEYHNFADRRALLGVPHFWNVASNLPFAFVGLAGCWWLLRRGSEAAFTSTSERIAYLVFFAGEFLTAFGSAYYHSAPDNGTLVWDRLVFSLLLTSAFAVVTAEFVSRRAGQAMLAPAVALGIVSVLLWGWSETRGQGDLRLYLMVQFYPVLAIPLILLLFRPRYTHAGSFWLVWTLFVAAKGAEYFDAELYEVTGAWSGHTLKHLVACGATYALLDMLRRRAIATSSNASLDRRSRSSRGKTCAARESGGVS